MLIQEIKKYLDNKFQGKHNAFLKNLVKEYLQFYILDFLYSNKKYNKKLFFIGGTCLRFCYDLPRLSEDLDFNTIEKIDTEELKDDLLNFFQSQLFFKKLDISIKGVHEKIYLKFDILKELGLSQESESSRLYVKLEIEGEKFSDFDLETSFINKNNFNFFIKHYSLSDLMTGKLNAIFTRSYFKGNHNEIDFKGRDYFDLLWYLNNGVDFKLDRLNKGLKLARHKIFKNKEDVFQDLKNRVDEMNINHLKLDLLPFIEDQNFLENYLDNFKEVFNSLIRKR